MTDRAPDLTVSVVSYNTVDLVTACLRSVFANAGDLALEVILVDNASEDDTVERVRAEFPQVSVVANAENRYFARGHNQAARLARGRYILFLNSDTLVLPRTLPALVAFLDAHPEYGAAGCQEQSRDGTVHITGSAVRTPLGDLVGLGLPPLIFPSWRRRTLARLRLADWDRRSSRPVAILTDAFLMVRRDLFLAMGGYDERFKLYYTEDDLCRRLWERGAGVYFLADVGYVHYQHQSTNQLAPGRLPAMYGRDRFYYHRKWHGSLWAMPIQVTAAARHVLAGFLLFLKRA